MKVPIYNLQHQQTGEAEVSDAVFGARWNPDLVHQIVTATAANRRKPLAHAKTRGEVSGGGKKPWRQKGTGRARHGSIRSPLWKGGGVTHGPRNDRSYKVHVNKKMARAALHSVLSKKLAEREIFFIDAISLSEPKTKILSGMLAAFFAQPKKKYAVSTLLVPARGEKGVFRAARNIKTVTTVAAGTMSAEDVLRHASVLIAAGATDEIK